MSTGDAPAVEIVGLSKVYSTGLVRRTAHTALHDLSLRVVRGEILGYLGPNGSGKTTTLKILMGLLTPDAGTARVLGLPHHDRRWRARAGFVPEQPYFYDYLTPWEYLDYAGRLFGLARKVRHDRSAALLERVGLASVRHSALRRFSKGMLQRVALAQALVNDPEIVFLDEPMSGLDPGGRRLVRDLILDLNRDGKTIFFSTHILSDAESLCDRVALLKAGQLVSAGRLDEILEVDVSHLEVLVGGLADHGRLEVPAGVEARRVGDRLRLQVPAALSLAPLVAAVETAGGRVLSLQPVRQSLEDYFFREMAQEGRGWSGD